MIIDHPTQGLNLKLQPARKIPEYFEGELRCNPDLSKNPSEGGSFSIFADQDELQGIQAAYDKAELQDFTSHGWGNKGDWNRKWKWARCTVQYAPPHVSTFKTRIYRDLKTGEDSVEYAQNPVGKEFVEERTRYHIVTERWIVYFGNNSIAVLSTVAAKRCVKSLRRRGKLIDACEAGKKLYERWQHELNR